MKTTKTTTRPVTGKRVTGRKPKPITRKVRVEVHMEPEAEDVGSLGALPILFREVLQQIPVADAWRMGKAYASGCGVIIAIHPSKYGSDRKTAFTWFVVSEDRIKEWTVEATLDGDAA